MRQARILGRGTRNYYHVMSRVVDKRPIFNAIEKEYFRKRMRKLEEFMGIRIMAYCIMSNHFHLLVEVPEIEILSDKALMLRIAEFYPKHRATELVSEYEEAQREQSPVKLNELRARYTERMGSLAFFLKELKQGFSSWYNRKHNRRGTLWEERFKSVLLEGTDHALLAVAAYIDLNPVRAGMVNDPKEYRFSSYGEAVAGRDQARRGLCRIMQSIGAEADWLKTGTTYRKLLYCKGEGTESRQGFDAETVREVLKANGELSTAELIHCRLRYLNDGVALGSRSFVEEVFEVYRDHFGPRRKNGARRIPGSPKKSGFYCLRRFNDALAVP